MIGILVQLAISWLIIWFFEKKNLDVLGWFPSGKNITDLLLFSCITASLCASEFLLRYLLANHRWQMNPAFSINLLWKGFIWNLNSVLFEELIFRGVLLYILIRRLGQRKAMVMSAIAFGIYHWFSYGILGQPIPMVYIFVITSIMGLLLAYAYAKTFSLYVPIAIHLGWNFTNGFIFSKGPIGNGVLIPANFEAGPQYDMLTYLVVSFLPMLLMWTVNYALLRKKVQVPMC